MSQVPLAEYAAGEGEDCNNVPVRSERNLLAAVMARAICDAFGTAHCEKHIVRAARSWLFSKLTPKRPFSFAWVAIQLELDPTELQNRLRAQTQASMIDQIAILRS